MVHAEVELNWWGGRREGKNLMIKKKKISYTKRNISRNFSSEFFSTRADNNVRDAERPVALPSQPVKNHG